MLIKEKFQYVWSNRNRNFMHFTGFLVSLLLIVFSNVNLVGYFLMTLFLRIYSIFSREVDLGEICQLIWFSYSFKIHINFFDFEAIALSHLSSMLYKSSSSDLFHQLVLVHNSVVKDIDKKNNVTVRWQCFILLSISCAKNYSYQSSASCYK